MRDQGCLWIVGVDVNVTQEEDVKTSLASLSTNGCNVILFLPTIRLMLGQSLI